MGAYIVSMDIPRTAYEAGQEEMLQFVQRLINENIAPYVGSLSGEWKASRIRTETEYFFEHALRLSISGRNEIREVFANPYNGCRNLLETCAQFTKAIDEEISRYMWTHKRAPFFIIDFQIFKNDVCSQFLAIRKRFARFES